MREIQSDEPEPEPSRLNPSYPEYLHPLPPLQSHEDGPSTHEQLTRSEKLEAIMFGVASLSGDVASRKTRFLVREELLYHASGGQVAVSRYDYASLSANKKLKEWVEHDSQAQKVGIEIRHPLTTYEDGNEEHPREAYMITVKDGEHVIEDIASDEASSVVDDKTIDELVKLIDVLHATERAALEGKSRP